MKNITDPSFFIWTPNIRTWQKLFRQRVTNGQQEGKVQITSEALNELLDSIHLRKRHVNAVTVHSLPKNSPSLTTD